jgi:hypothetical protein
MEIPAPFFLDADETSISLSFKPTPGLLESGSVALEYRLPHFDWSKGTRVPVECSVKTEQPKIDVLVADLLPGTPYVVRLVHVSKENVSTFGPEVVFDTAPIGCTPKRKKRSCTIS